MRPLATAVPASSLDLPVTRKSDLIELQRRSPPFGGFAAVPTSAVARIFASPGPIYELEARRPDFFRMARRRVRPGGIFCQWIQNYYLPAEDLRSILAAYSESFPHLLLFETFDGIDLLVLGSEQPLHLDLEALGRRLENLHVRLDLARIRVRGPVDLVSHFRLGTEEIRTLCAGAPRNTDDNARVEFSALR